MSIEVEILVAGKDAQERVTAALGGSRTGVRFSASVASRGRRDRMLVAVSSDLGSNALRNLVEAAPKAVPLVLFADAPRRTMFGANDVRWVARWSACRKQEAFLATSADSMRRLVLARRQNATKKLIASASLEGDTLMVWSCEPKRYEVKVAEIPALTGRNADVLADFTITPSGSRIHWNRCDVDINMDTVLEHADPATRRAHEKKRRADAARYARAVRALREEKGLKQGDISGLSERQVRRLESGECVPQIASLRTLAAAHSMETNDYLAELARRASRSRRKSLGCGSISSAPTSRGVALAFRALGSEARCHVLVQRERDFGVGV